MPHLLPNNPNKDNVHAIVRINPDLFKGKTKVFLKDQTRSTYFLHQTNHYTHPLHDVCLLVRLIPGEIDFEIPRQLHRHTHFLKSTETTLSADRLRGRTGNSLGSATCVDFIILNQTLIHVCSLMSMDFSILPAPRERNFSSSVQINGVKGEKYLEGQFDRSKVLTVRITIIRSFLLLHPQTQSITNNEMKLVGKAL